MCGEEVTEPGEHGTVAKLVLAGGERGGLVALDLAAKSVLNRLQERKETVTGYQ